MELLVLAEHRRGEIREVTFEMLTKGREIAQKTNSRLNTIILGKNIRDKAEVLARYADRVLMIDDERFEFFNSDLYQQVLSNIIREVKPILTMIGHTSYGVDLAPSLAVSLNIPLITDCLDLDIQDGQLTAVRQMYGGKIYARLNVRKSESYIATIRQGVITASEGNLKGEIIELPPPDIVEPVKKKFIEYVLPKIGEVDITSADILVAIGRGIKDQANIPLAEELAKTLGGVLACSRPIVDKGWLPPDRQVGSSGKTVKPKLYLALGISGAFQHVIGMKNSQLIIAVNKDPNAPIFNVAHYGVVEDLFKIVPILTEKIKELKKKTS
ncbi:MAG: electron transfer flavoprotein subunit alpha/FixB family protein [Thaumarchaeota archaeon]|nr:electron transfer flavoprotein subunit alpha/FixB family protein [Candidatus Geocrenenecus arthurdayi]